MPVRSRPPRCGTVLGPVGPGLFALGLSLTPSLVLASGPEGGPSGPDPFAKPAPDTESPPEASPPPKPEPAPAPARGGTSLTDPGVWEALSGNELRLTLRDGSFSGKLMGIHDGALVFARAGDGLIVSLPATEVTRIHAPRDRQRARPPRPMNNGGGLIAGGAVLLGIGAPAVVAGIVMTGIFPGFFFINLPLLVPGGAMLGAGAAMMKVGVDRKRMWSAALVADNPSGLSLTNTYGPPLQLEGAYRLRF